jgi:phenylpropionate dioxygenase-like ring-hydroxylating dioxygenase large terminal subunit
MAGVVYPWTVQGSHNDGDLPPRRRLEASVTAAPERRPDVAPPGPEPRDGWWPVAASTDLGTTPVAVEVDGEGYVAFRPEPGGPAAVLPLRCPHRLVRLDHGSLVDGRLRCPYHGWEFGPDGRCALVPSAGPEAAPPPRASLTAPWGVKEQDGTLWVAPVEPGSGAAAPVDLRAREQVFGNLDPSLQHAWHPVAVRGGLVTGPGGGGDGADGELAAGSLTVRLLGRDWLLTLDPDGEPAAEPVDGGPPAAGVTQAYGLVWLAPADPAGDILPAPDDADQRFAGAWLVPDRSSSCAGVLADNFLDVAHFPFVHAGTFGAAEEPEVPPFEVEAVGDGFSSVQEQWFDNPEDPGVAAGLRPVRQRRRATYRFAPPFQLWLRLEELDAGAVKTILFFLQPEDADSTRIYTKMLLHNIGGVEVPGPEVVASEVAFEVAVLAEDLVLQQAMTVPGLPLLLRDELHVRADRSGVALRRALTAFAQREATPS